ncbi:hypothetical protein QF000_004327 [Paraburkholderia atlantica]|uniref:DUF3331 domain-containing protein n=2 Tax=Paraburkholderia atlantica TaxID=2654982 RepID=UPI003D23E50B
MFVEMEVQDTWARIVGSLARVERTGDEQQMSLSTKLRHADRSATRAGGGHATIIVVERPTMTSATIEWRDSTNCYYGAQLWRLVRARKSGVCALSGEPISRGDEIFKPCGRTDAVNADAMIRTSAMRAYPARNS